MVSSLRESKRILDGGASCSRRIEKKSSRRMLRRLVGQISLHGLDIETRPRGGFVAVDGVFATNHHVLPSCVCDVWLFARFTRA